ncbi:uncharacterized protein F5891DRAFT_200818 [Suillus fuscotomentosus]|uniref:Uncharacterized protein n=1 Tax=Suillus fuscotomentosus TaxID=1912939 RepID=A0AAD4HCD5_9AGAM|nr:uncharacterized protein F5891DRAFT_200818 [Suillus fuscotomentosus]KAG1887902.1 hypothetical protein F5891DRAFT_200818 [Suillus fuscotomentosus]
MRLNFGGIVSFSKLQRVYGAFYGASQLNRCPEYLRPPVRAHASITLPECILSHQVEHCSYSSLSPSYFFERMYIAHCNITSPSNRLPRLCAQNATKFRGTASEFSHHCHGHRENAAPLPHATAAVFLNVLVLQTSHGLEGAPIPYMYIHAPRVTVRRYHRDSQYSRSSDSSALISF